MRGEMIREKLHRGDRVYGTHVCSMMNPLAAKLNTQINFDFVFICNEHMPLDRSETSMMCQFYAAHDMSPIVRIPDPRRPEYAPMALDAGAQGIVAPYVEEVEDVRKLVGAVKYRPIKGRFLEQILAGEREPASRTRDFLNQHNRDNYLIVGIESVPAIDNLEALIGVEGVDGVFLGPHDITVSMEIPTEYGHPKFQETVVDVVRRCRAKGVGVGLHKQIQDLEPGFVERLMEAGMNWIVNGSDIREMRMGLDHTFDRMRQTYGDGYQPRGDERIMPGSCIA